MTSPHGAGSRCCVSPLLACCVYCRDAGGKASGWAGASPWHTYFTSRFTHKRALGPESPSAAWGAGGAAPTGGPDVTSTRLGCCKAGSGEEGGGGGGSREREARRRGGCEEGRLGGHPVPRRALMQPQWPQSCLFPVGLYRVLLCGPGSPRACLPPWQAGAHVPAAPAALSQQPGLLTDGGGRC